ncbi:AAA-like domain-containing protein [Nostoc sp. CHAB 5784]|uniref:AAA-like domain-containing protein n=1 Tax=Nostoc mirabile TaxID=2907820 RepID=UPI001E50AD9B|nr:AAA-like domain-containing protein [Nostoc mirabile]MCC5669237.1 AAA-like domain-containing protein [Nostoc mirabile CHAB5784]
MRSIEQIIECTETLITNKTGKSLSFIQKAVLSASLLETKKNYAQIAIENNYSENYIRQLVAPKLWQLLSNSLGEKVNRTNCRAVLEQRLDNSFLQTISQPTHMWQKINLEPPDGQVPLDSTLYIERGLEQVCYQAILQPRAFIHIKAPRKMGKTSLMTRILAHGSSHGYYTVRLSLHRAETEVFSSLEKFLRWFCTNVTHQLGIKSKLEEYWDEEMGDLMNCTIYFQGYVLQEINTPLILALDEVNKLFEYPQLTRDFLGLLRSWYEETRDISIWQKLRVLIVKSTDIYINLEINKSPFNIGLAIDLPAFTRLQLEDLAQRHRLQLTAFQFEQLMALTGGFPYLVRLAFYHSVQHQIPMDTLVQNATTNTGIFSEYLHNQLHSILQNPDLVDGFQQVIRSTVPITLEQEVAFKLKSLGLIYLEKKTATVSCGLYREYFSDYFINKTAILNHS